MKKTSLLLTLLLLSLPCQLIAETEKSPFSYGGENDFVSRYVWRGITFSNGPVLQPSAWISAYDLTLTSWSDITLTDESDLGVHSAFNEEDILLEYSKEFFNFTLEPSFTLYFYPNQDDSPVTGELGFKLSHPVGPIRLFTYHAFDVIKYGGSYYGELGASLEHELLSHLNFEVSSWIGWGSATFHETYLGLSKSDLTLFGTELTMTYYPLEYLYLKPHVSVTSLIDNELRAQQDDPDVICGGLTIGVEF